MKIVIDIPMETYKKFMINWTGTTNIIHAVRYGTPLPKGHGRLIDADALTEKAPEIKEYLDVLAPTIIEADTENKNGTN